MLRYHIFVIELSCVHGSANQVHKSNVSISDGLQHAKHAVLKLNLKTKAHIAKIAQLQNYNSEYKIVVICKIV